MITEKIFDYYNGKAVKLYTLHGRGIEVGICDFGARIQFIKIETENGIKDVCLAFNSTEEYVERSTYFGATIGRCANRIANGKFSLNNEVYQLDCNDGKHHLHGGNVGFDKKFFDAVIDGNFLKLTLKSKDGESGYPGNFEFTVIYSLQEKELSIEYFGKTDKDTIWNPTNHTFFNLNGDGSGDIYDNVLKINADGFTPADGTLIPTGEIRQVAGTPFDFTEFKPIGKDINADDSQIKSVSGYDHNFILRGNYAASAYSKNTGIRLDVFTDMPAIQLYTANMLQECNGKNGKYGKHTGFCLEPQFCPNAINISSFTSPVLKKSEHKGHYIKFNFSIVDSNNKI